MTDVLEERSDQLAGELARVLAEWKAGTGDAELVVEAIRDFAEVIAASVVVKGNEMLIEQMNQPGD